MHNFLSSGRVVLGILFLFTTRAESVSRATASYLPCHHFNEVLLATPPPLLSLFVSCSRISFIYFIHYFPLEYFCFSGRNVVEYIEVPTTARHFFATFLNIFHHFLSNNSFVLFCFSIITSYCRVYSDSSSATITAVFSLTSISDGRFECRTTSLRICGFRNHCPTSPRYD